MKDIFQQFIQIASHGSYEQLAQIKLRKPAYFNWAADVFEALHVAKHPDKEALILAKDNGQVQRFSYRGLSEQASQLLNFWRSRGIAQQNSVFIMVPICAQLWPTYIAGIKGGQVLIPTATIMSEKDLEYRFRCLLPDVVVSDFENTDKIEAAENAVGKQAKVKMLIGDKTKAGWVNFAEIAAQPANAEAAQTKPDDALFLFFTSGTTGMPKVVTHTHFSYPVGHLSTAAWVGIKPSDVHFNISQPGWAKYAWSSFFAPLNVGATLFAFIQEGSFSATAHLKALEQYPVTTFCAPPTVLRLLIQEDLQQYNFRLRECVSAGEPLNPEVIAAWQKGTGLLIRDGYGQTESTAMVYNLPGGQIKYGSMGKPSFMYDIIIANEQGDAQPPLEEGHIAVRMREAKPNGIFKEYFGEPERKQAVFRHGLYYTGDKAYMDEEGYVWFVGRDDDVIKSSDYRVGPFEVESVLVDHAAVVEAAVVGSPHPIKGHEVKAFVILKKNATPSEPLANELFQFCRQHLAAYKRPRIIEFVDELPKTISGKIRRVELRAQEEQKKLNGTTAQQEYFYRRTPNHKAQ